ncbi:MAG TPA: four helix bundle protein [Gemmatimonadaceae bacterium]
MIRSYRDLAVWRRAVNACIVVYRMTSNFPPEERFGITSQLRRAAVSIPSNIAEGHERNGRKEFLAHVHVARGELAEVETQLTIARALGYAGEAQLASVMDEYSRIGRMLTRLAQRLRPVPKSRVPVPPEAPGPRPQPPPLRSPSPP